jgi:signal transduction histidine kinase
MELSVKDNGVGMDDTILSRLFTYGHTTKSRGHGIGLHVSALAAQEMGGRLVASSPGLGQGSTFTLSLPPATPTGERA